MSRGEDTEPPLPLESGPDLQPSVRGEPWKQQGVAHRGHQAKRARVENIIKVMSRPDASANPQRESSATRDEETSVTEEDGSSTVLRGGWNSKHQGWKKTKLMNYFQSRPENMHVLADALKAELSRAVSRSVDSVFKSMQENAEAGRLLSRQSAQTEAPSPPASQEAIEPRQSFPHPQSTGYHTAHPTFPGSQHDPKVRLKVNSRSVQGPPMEQMLWGKLCHPQVKVESNSLLRSHLYLLNHLQEGLTTKHLKKAKLMFFFTRYPSSLVLRMCFHDVQFTRCIGSQLIKWFSNFREFFYIQMEKFARHAAAAGRSDLRGLTVGRESELFRTLNMHYNKANDFQVPDQFLEVAEITLREFYVAISMGKDGDPSWKKAIYKVICKLDSEVPAEFKSHG
ncbi:uncharacterized protein ACB057_009401 [Neosynchiropus ocellatus]